MTFGGEFWFQSKHFGCSVSREEGAVEVKGLLMFECFPHGRCPPNGASTRVLMKVSKGILSFHDSNK